MASHRGLIIYTAKELAELLQLPEGMIVTDITTNRYTDGIYFGVDVKHPELPEDDVSPDVIIKYRKLKNGTYKRTSWKQKAYRG